MKCNWCGGVITSAAGYIFTNPEDYFLRGKEKIILPWCGECAEGRKAYNESWAREDAAQEAARKRRNKVYAKEKANAEREWRRSAARRWGELREFFRDNRTYGTIPVSRCGWIPGGSGWAGDTFVMISSGRKIVRYWHKDSPEGAGLPKFAWSKPFAPKRRKEKAG